jgi:hypothetical protein
MTPSRPYHANLSTAAHAVQDAIHASQMIRARWRRVSHRLERAPRDIGGRLILVEVVQSLRPLSEVLGLWQAQGAMAISSPAASAESLGK